MVALAIRTGHAPQAPDEGFSPLLIERTAPMGLWARALSCWTLLAVSSVLLAAEPSHERQETLRYMLLQDCGSCHGLTLRGGLGPALLPSNLSDKPVAFLAATIIYGRPGTPMPPWGPFITEDEAVWLATQLKQGLAP